MAQILGGIMRHLKMFLGVHALIILIIALVSYRRVKLDEFYIGVVASSLVLSLLSLAGTLYLHKVTVFYWLDCLYHGGFSPLLFVASCLFIHSTRQMQGEIISKIEKYTVTGLPGLEFQLAYYNERIAVSIMTMLQAGLFAAVVYLYRRAGAIKFGTSGSRTVQT